MMVRPQQKHLSMFHPKLARKKPKKLEWSIFWETSRIPRLALWAKKLPISWWALKVLKWNWKICTIIYSRWIYLHTYFEFISNPSVLLHMNWYFLFYPGGGWKITHESPNHVLAPRHFQSPARCNQSSICEIDQCKHKWPNVGIIYFVFDQIHYR